MLIDQLQRDDDVIGRIDAAKELAKLATPEAIEALKGAVLNDGFWGVQSEAARALGGIRTANARDALLETLKVKHPKARRGVVAGLGQFRNDEQAAAALEQIVRKGDPSYYVEAQAAHSLGLTADRACVRRPGGCGDEEGFAQRRHPLERAHRTGGAEGRAGAAHRHRMDAAREVEPGAWRRDGDAGADCRS